MDVLTTFELLFTFSRPFGVFPFRVRKLSRVSSFLESPKTYTRSKTIVVFLIMIQGLALIHEVWEEVDHASPLSKKTVNVLNVAVFTVGGVTLYRSVIAKTSFLRNWLNKMNVFCVLLKSDHGRLLVENSTIVWFGLFNYLINIGPRIVSSVVERKKDEGICEQLESLYVFAMMWVVNLFCCQFLTFTNAGRFAYLQINGVLKVLKPERVHNGALVLQSVKANDMFVKNYLDAVNSVYMINIFISLFWSFLSILYVTVNQFTSKGSSSGMLQFVMWIIYLFLQIISILGVCQSTFQEAEKTANYVHELFLNNNDPEIKEEVEIFSLQLQHRKVEFSACGFFQLDFSLLYSMVGSVTTYIIILMQFQREDLTANGWIVRKTKNCSVLLNGYPASDILDCINATVNL